MALQKPYKMKLVCGKKPWGDWVTFYLMAELFEDGKNKHYYAELLELTEVKEAFFPFPPVFDLDLKNAQSLMDELWECGLRPSQGAGSAGALLATQNHLKDMQEIVKHTLKMNKH